MTKAPVFLTGLPAARHVPEPAGTDLLSDALRQLRLSGAALLRCDFTSPWAWAAPHAGAFAGVVGAPERRLMLFHIVAHGQCWIQLDDQPRVELQAGELVVLPHGDPHRMGCGEAEPIQIGSLFPAPPWRQLPVLRHGGAGALTRIVCTWLSFDLPLFNPLLSSLPSLLVLRHADGSGRDWIRSSVRYIADDSWHGQSGASFLMDRLAELLFLETVRLHLAALPPGHGGWLAALRDRHVARALHLLHTRARDPWTIEALARQVGLSRSPLERRFNTMLGMPAMRYLTLWRLQQASALLADGQRAVGAIAADVGYASEEAFSRAFKRHTGHSPLQWRRGRRAAGRAEALA